MNYSISL